MGTLWENICSEFKEYKEQLPEEDPSPKVSVQKVGPDEELTDDLTKCSSVKYIRTQMIPIIREALTQMIDTAEDNDVFKYKRKNKFNPCDFLTEFLYNNNPKRKGEDPVSLSDIPFVSKWDKTHPRPILPLSMRISEEKAAIMIQSWWRGIAVRKRPEVLELREYQEEWRKANREE